MTGESVFAAVLVTIALGILLRGLMTLVWTLTARWHPLEKMGIQNESITLPGLAAISTFGLAAVVCAIVIYAGLFLCLKYTRWGLRMRAVGENPLLAAQRGIDLHLYYGLSWAIAAFTAGVAGTIIACDGGLLSQHVRHRPHGFSGSSLWGAWTAWSVLSPVRSWCP